MSPVTHFLIGWIVAEGSGAPTRRDRALIAAASVIPDLDGVGAIVELATRNTDHPILWFSEYHHALAHNIGFCLVVCAFGVALATRRVVTPAVMLFVFHLHLLCDVVGARGPDGEQWPIPYLLPFSLAWEWTWSGQWALNAWPNFVITGLALAVMFYLAWRRGRSPVEIFSAKADEVFVRTLRNRFHGSPKNPFPNGHGME
ncbi:MAG: metal-dependent hydrolase [Acidobacteriota bacterium]